MSVKDGRYYGRQIGMKSLIWKYGMLCREKNMAGHNRRREHKKQLIQMLMVLEFYKREKCRNKM
jgi:hypothetical protein